MVSLRKKRMKIVGTVPVRERLEGGVGKVVCEAKMELTRSGTVVAHIDMRHMSADILLRGFTLGEFTMPDPDKDNNAAKLES